MNCPKCKNTVIKSSYQPIQNVIRIGGISVLGQKLPESHARLEYRYHCDKCNTSFILEAGF